MKPKKKVIKGWVEYYGNGSYRFSKYRRSFLSPKYLREATLTIEDQDD